MGHPTALSIRNRALAGAAIVVAVALSASPIRAASLVPEGRPAPDFQLTTLAGQTVHLADEQGHPVVLLFGELYNRNSVSAVRDAAAVLARPALAGLGATAYFLMTEPGSDAKRQADARTRGITLSILRDPGRRTFASDRVYVLPSLIVLDAKGVTVLASAGYYKIYRAPRELHWVSGIALFGLTLFLAFTGYLLPWTNLSFWGASVGTEIPGAVPYLGESIVIWLRRGPSISGETLGFFFSMHIWVLPALTAGLMGMHFAMIRRTGISRPL